MYEDAGREARRLQKNTLIRNHLRNLIILGIPLDAIYNGAFCPGCRVRMLDEEGSFGITGVIGVERVEVVALSYVLDGYMYGLVTDARSNVPDPPPGVLPIQLPRRIFRIERRRSCRVTCSADEPVKVVVRSKGEETETEATVMSEDSAALLLTPLAPVPALDSAVTLDMDLPGLGVATVTGTVRFVRDSSGGQGLVVRFDEMSESDREMLRRYVRARQFETLPDGGDTRESGFVVARQIGGRRHLFWCPSNLLGTIKVTDEALDVISVDGLEFL